jgi:hypothetical protein
LGNYVFFFRGKSIPVFHKTVDGGRDQR